MDNTVEDVIEQHEIHAIDRGDIIRAIRYNWIRNAVRSSQLDGDKALSMVSYIHTFEPARWPEMRFI